MYGIDKENKSISISYGMKDKNSKFIVLPESILGTLFVLLYNSQNNLLAKTCIFAEDYLQASSVNTYSSNWHYLFYAIGWNGSIVTHPIFFIVRVLSLKHTSYSMLAEWNNKQVRLIHISYKNDKPGTV